MCVLVDHGESDMRVQQEEPQQLLPQDLGLQLQPARRWWQASGSARECHDLNMGRGRIAMQSCGVSCA